MDSVLASCTSIIFRSLQWQKIVHKKKCLTYFVFLFEDVHQKSNKISEARQAERTTLLLPVSTHSFSSLKLMLPPSDKFRILSLNYFLSRERECCLWSIQ